MEPVTCWFFVHIGCYAFIFVCKTCCILNFLFVKLVHEFFSSRTDFVHGTFCVLILFEELTASGFFMMVKHVAYLFISSWILYIDSSPRKTDCVHTICYTLIVIHGNYCMLIFVRENCSMLIFFFIFFFHVDLFRKVTECWNFFVKLVVCLFFLRENCKWFFSSWYGLCWCNLLRADFYSWNLFRNDFCSWNLLLIEFSLRETCTLIFLLVKFFVG